MAVPEELESVERWELRAPSGTLRAPGHPTQARLLGGSGGGSGGGKDGGGGPAVDACTPLAALGLGTRALLVVVDCDA